MAERFGRAGWHIGLLVAGRRFHLRRVDRPPPRPETGPLGVPFQPRDETMKPTSRTTGRRGIRTPPAVGGGPITSCRTDSPNLSARLGGRRGIRRQSTRSSTWHGETPQGIVVVEVKSCTKQNEVRQLRMGIGQVLDYDDSLRARGRAVLPVLYLEREPSDARWVALAKRHHVHLIWPGTEHVLV